MKKMIVLMLIFGLTLNCDDIIEIEDITNKQVEILAPSDNSVLVPSNITFSWTALEQVDSYHLQIATPNFENATQIIIDTLVVATNLSNELSLGDYQWRVRAQNSQYQTQYTTQNFSIEE
ncbi:hypothetical protein [Psychroserpens sp.]|uniref:hypothetical protein n=1 Tax=Psychroserpens sp. TaxID=2020870 RepID=UPI002B277D95|nr:hypothetical protein [Psychroserpens sp.]